MRNKVTPRIVNCISCGRDTYNYDGVCHKCVGRETSFEKRSRQFEAKYHHKPSGGFEMIHGEMPDDYQREDGI